MRFREKILRVVEYGSFERVGSSKTVEVDVRIVAATNEDMPKLCEQNRFKRDLLDRLSFEVLFLPPLRERGSDIHLLAEHFCVRMARELGMTAAPAFSDRVNELISTYSWPGNIRELKNVIERAVYKCSGGRLEDLTIDPFKNPYSGPDPNEAGERSDEKSAEFVEKTVSVLPKLDSLRSKIREIEISFLRRALEESGNNQKLAAEKLALSYDQFRGLYRKYKEEL